MDQPRIIGRYALCGEIASGGMATVHFGRLLGPVGFARTVAIKRMHPQYAKDPEFVSMFLDEARIAARIRHPNVVSTLDVVAMTGELFIVMEYIEGESLYRLLRAGGRRGEQIPIRIVVSIASNLLLGLHGAHEATTESKKPLGIIHRDVSPQNVLVGTDGVARVLDFGVAKAAGRLQSTRDGQLKGKFAYMAPEQIRGDETTRAADIWAAGVVIWEAFTGQRLFPGENDAEIMMKVLEGRIPRASSYVELPAGMDDVLRKALSLDPAQRFATAREMAIAMERCVQPASSTEVGDWVCQLARDTLTMRAEQVAHLESSSSSDLRAPDSIRSPHAAPKDGVDVNTTVERRLRSEETPVSFPRASRPSDTIIVRRRDLIVVSAATLSLLLMSASVFFSRSPVLMTARAGISSAAPPIIVRPETTREVVAETTAAAADSVDSVASPVVTAEPKGPAPSPRSDAGTTPRPTSPPRPVGPVPPTPKVDCVPPYTLDPQGHRVYKPACL